jgi:hypothetical protein
MNMNAFWRAVLEQVIIRLMKQDWAYILERVQYYLDVDMPGKAKQAAVINELRAAGSCAATFLLGASVDVAYGMVTKKPLFSDE